MPRPVRSPSLAAHVAHLVVSLALPATAACGGMVVFEEDDGGGGGPSTGATTASSNTVVTGSDGITSTASGASGCTRHEDCGSDLCVFATGACAPACDGEACDGCGPGSFCDECATSSCPDCRDCLAACVPADGRCDDDDPCPTGSICHFREGRCSAGCTADGSCEDLSEVCAPCESSSCCGCKDCVGGCIVPED